MWLEKLTENHKLGALCIQNHQSLLKEFILFYFFLRIKVSCEYKRESNFQKKFGLINITIIVLGVPSVQKKTRKKY